MARARWIVAGIVLASVGAVPLAASAGGKGEPPGQDKLSKIDHIVVIYEENHSFDNLYGGWEGVNGRADASPATTTQLSQAGAAYQCLLQNDVNLTSPVPLPTTCIEQVVAPGSPPKTVAVNSAFQNQPFTIDDYIAPTDTTCPAPGVFAANGVPRGSGLPGGCTRDLVHRFYQEQYQLDGGQQNRYVTGSDAVGLVMGGYDTTRLPIYQYLHGGDHPKYAIADNFFQAAFGGSFLNHQWLVAAATPVFSNAVQSGPDDLHSVLDANGFPNSSYPLYAPTNAVIDGALTAKCTDAHVAGRLCGDYAVNTIQPAYQPFAPGTTVARRLPPQTNPTIGDRLNDARVSWAWYSGGWANADGETTSPYYTNGAGPTCSDPAALATATYPTCPDKLFQFHHQAFNYFASFAPGTANRAAHLRDEQEFIATVKASKKACGLRSVSLVKPIGEENEHPGYASVAVGSDHLVSLLSSIEHSACKHDTMVVVTYDEFGGQWDHVAPPGQHNEAGPHDLSGPGTRIPALVIAPYLKGDFVVDSVSHDTTSILATIEHRFGLPPLTTRDAAVADLSSVFRAHEPHDD
jgi:acid phosphatase